MRSFSVDVDMKITPEGERWIERLKERGRVHVKRIEGVLMEIAGDIPKEEIVKRFNRNVRTFDNRTVYSLDGNVVLVDNSNLAVDYIELTRVDFVPYEEYMEKNPAMPHHYNPYATWQD